MSARPQAKKLAIEHVTDGSERLPIADIRTREGPCEACNTKTAHYFRTLVNVGIVIVINEIVAQRLAEDQPCDSGKKNAYARDRETGLKWNANCTLRVDVGNCQVIKASGGVRLLLTAPNQNMVTVKRRSRLRGLQTLS